MKDIKWYFHNYFVKKKISKIFKRKKVKKKESLIWKRLDSSTFLGTVSNPKSKCPLSEWHCFTVCKYVMMVVMCVCGGEGLTSRSLVYCLPPISYQLNFTQKFRSHWGKVSNWTDQNMLFRNFLTANGKGHDAKTWQQIFLSRLFYNYCLSKIRVGV